MDDHTPALTELAAHHWPAVQQLVGWLGPSRTLPMPADAVVKAYADLARVLLVQCHVSDPQLLHALHALLVSKDAAERATLSAHGLVQGPFTPPSMPLLSEGGRFCGRADCERNGRSPHHHRDD